MGEEFKGAGRGLRIRRAMARSGHLPNAALEANLLLNNELLAPVQHAQTAYLMHKSDFFLPDGRCSTRRHGGLTDNAVMTAHFRHQISRLRNSHGRKQLFFR